MVAAMLKLICLVVVLGLLSLLATAQAKPAMYTYNWNTFGKLDHFIKKPSQDILVGGRLTTRQVAEIAESGFQSFVSMSTFINNDSSFNGVPGDFPSSAVEQGIIESYDLSYTLYQTAYNVTDARKLSEILTAAPKPTFLHCFVSTVICCVVSLLTRGYHFAVRVHRHSVHYCSQISPWTNQCH
jgi:uncharacterized membrane protein